MPAAWSGTLDQLWRLRQSGIDRLTFEIQRGFSQNVLPAISSDAEITWSQFRSWSMSISSLSKALAAPQMKSIQVVLELLLPGTPRKIADALLLGGSQNDLQICVIELKQWSRATIADRKMKTLNVPFVGKPQLHPKLQLLEYAERINTLLKRRQNYCIFGAVWLHNMEKTYKSQFDLLDDDLAKKIPIFTREQPVSLANFVKSRLLPVTLHPDEHQQFVRSLAL